MGKLVYSAIGSADGYVEDAAGGFDWAAPDEELLAFVNDLERPIGTYLYGRRMYETMLYWEAAQPVPGQSAADREFAGIWQGADKIVFSRTLDSVSSARTRLEPKFDPGMVRELKSAADRDLTVGGADLAGQALAAGLVDEVQLILVPVLVGGGKRALPDRVRLGLELADTRRFGSGAVYLGYRVKLPRVPRQAGLIRGHRGQAAGRPGRWSGRRRGRPGRSRHPGTSSGRGCPTASAPARSSPVLTA
jgi:dihydrofolate reductase